MPAHFMPVCAGGIAGGSSALQWVKVLTEIGEGAQRGYDLWTAWNFDRCSASHKV